MSVAPLLALGLAAVLSTLSGNTPGMTASAATPAPPVPPPPPTVQHSATSVRPTATPRCGSSTTLREGSKTWTCTFDDEFNANTVDTSKWSAETTAGSGWTTSDTCYIANGTTISEGGGSLHLTARQLKTPMSCAGAYNTVHTGGAVVTAGKFSQAYGRFEIRAKFPATDDAGFWGNLWLYPQNLTYGAWPNSGEVDMAEHWSGHGDAVVSTLHYGGSTGADSRSCNVNVVSQFHTYVMEWNSSTITFSRDGQTCFTRDWTSVTGSSKPFDKPFFIMLSEGYGDYVLPFASSLPATGPVDVDYVRVYK